MEVIRLLLLEKDMEYGQTLGKAISSLNNEFFITIQNIEDRNTVDPAEYHIILAGGLSEKERNDLGIDLKKVVWLIEDQTAGKKAQTEIGNEVLHIYKYSKVSEIISNLRFAYGLITGKSEVYTTNPETRLVGFYSGSGGAGTTVVSIGTARELSRYQGKKVLYLNYEEISSTLFYLSNGTEIRSISDYLYYLFQKKNGNICSFLDSFTYRDPFGVSTFYPNEGRNELKQLTPDELSYFINTLIESRKYDYIILDFSCDLNEETKHLLHYCSKIVFITTEREIHRYKEKLLLDYFSQIFNPEKLITAMNQSLFLTEYKENKSNSANQTKSVIRIEKDDNSFCYNNEKIEISINQIFGLGIKTLTNEILC